MGSAGQSMARWLKPSCDVAFCPDCLFVPVRLHIRCARNADRGDMVILKSRLGMGRYFRTRDRRRRLISFVLETATQSSGEVGR